MMPKTRAQRRREARSRQAVEMREKNWSLRDIANHLDVHHDTIREDLVRWNRIRKVSDFPVGKPTKSVGDATSESDNNVIELSRGKTG
jgi:transposase